MNNYNNYKKNQQNQGHDTYTNRQIPLKQQVMHDMQRAKEEMDDARQRYKANKRLTGQNTETAKRVYEATVDKFLDKLKPYLKKESPNLLLKVIWPRNEDMTIYEANELNKEELKKADDIVLLEEYGELLNQHQEIETKSKKGLATPSKTQTATIPLNIPEQVTFEVHNELNQAYYDLDFSKMGEDWQTLQG